MPNNLAGQRAHQAPRIAILIPCYNEEGAIGQVIRDFTGQLPNAELYIFDNGSTDRTIEEATAAGAHVRRETRRGKGHVLRAMCQQVAADIYVMVDRDATYPADKIHELLRPVLDDEADMVIGSRLHTGSESRFKVLNLLGNRLFRFLLNTIFQVHITDLLSGYRVMNRQLVKGVPFLSRGFESETELTIKCLARGYRLLEVPINLGPRPEGTRSKIRVFQDGLLILDTIFALARDYKPLTAFGLIGGGLICLGWLPGFIAIREFVATGRILHFPSAILAVGLVLSGVMVMFTGLVLHTIARHFQELDYQLQRLLDAKNTA